MCTLGYPRALISIENFKVPHFELVATSSSGSATGTTRTWRSSTRSGRSTTASPSSSRVAEQLLVKARVKLNLKNLYASNGFAVRELLKVATLLHDAHRNASADADENDESIPADIGPGHKFNDIRLTRNLAADITKYGARLHELLGSHAEAKENAARALGKNFDVDYLQKQLHQMNAQVSEQAESLRSALANLQGDEANLQQRIDKKRAELDRHEKRFASLKAVRPAFMDEYERLEAELAGQYAMYVQAWRNLSYLESELDEINGEEEDAMRENDRQMQMMQKRLREEELRVLRGHAQVDERALDDALAAGANMKRRERRDAALAAAAAAAAAARRRPGRVRRRTSLGRARSRCGGGNMYGGGMYGGIDDDGRPRRRRRVGRRRRRAARGRRRHASREGGEETAGRRWRSARSL